MAEGVHEAALVGDAVTRDPSLCTAGATGRRQRGRAVRNPAPTRGEGAAAGPDLQEVLDIIHWKVELYAQRLSAGTADQLWRAGPEC